MSQLDDPTTSSRRGSGEAGLAKVRFFDVTPASFQWESRVSLDGGATWYRNSAIAARRA